MCKTHAVTNLAISTVTGRIPTLTPFMHRCSFMITGSNDNSFFAVRRTVRTIPSFHGTKHAAVLIHGKMCGRGIIVPRDGVDISLVNRSKTVLAGSSFTTGGGCFKRRVSASNSSAYCVCTPSFCTRGVAFRGDTNEIKRTITYFIDKSHTCFGGYHFLKGRSALCACNGSDHRFCSRYCVRNAISFVFN